ncbi:ABC transporter ATP-binding protein [Tepidamorphus sp. 3E244]|uniref:ABC transporter ATP-binding protein n=1 Tax=Tepidamorphus sp. 3E244 TaxID=3385498 RepID=UPI0038FC01AB
MSQAATAAQAPATDALLDVREIHTYYGDSHVLQGVTLDVKPGECVALLGRNGAGKTTTLRSIVSLTPVRRGQVSFGGFDITRWPTHRIIREGIGYVPEDRGIFSSLSVREHLDVAMWAGKQTAERRDEVLKIFPRISERMEHFGQQLSGGEQQMLSIARALLTKPKLLILDEPSEGLAPIIVDEVRDTLKEVKGTGTSILLVEQNVAMALALADRVVVLSQGMVQFTGTPAELEAQPQIKDTYLGIA